MDRVEMTERARQGLPIYGHSDEPVWVQGAAYRNSAFSQLKFSEWILPYSISHMLTAPRRYLPNVSWQSRQFVSSPLIFFQAQLGQPPPPRRRPSEVQRGERLIDPLSSLHCNLSRFRSFSI